MSADDSINALFQLLSKYDLPKTDFSSEHIAKQISKHNDLMGLELENKLIHLSHLNKYAISAQLPTLKEFALKALNSPIPDGLKIQLSS